jgi:ABC-type antimicrobial peptide transport system permease subunit
MLAAVGVYGMVTSAVEQRTQEVGVRLALGASPSEIFETLLKRELGTVAMGIALGLGAAALLTRFAVRLFYDVTPTDPVTLAAVSLLLAVVALLAAVVPLRRALRVDPVIALRSE